MDISCQSVSTYYYQLCDLNDVSSPISWKWKEKSRWNVVIEYFWFFSCDFPKILCHNRDSRGASWRGRGEDRGPYPQFFEDEDETEGCKYNFSRPRTRRGPRLVFFLFLVNFEDKSFFKPREICRNIVRKIPLLNVTIRYKMYKVLKETI